MRILLCAQPAHSPHGRTLPVSNSRWVGRTAWHASRGIASGASDNAFFAEKAGYGTMLIGKWHLGNPPNFGPRKSGYDHFWGFYSGGVDYFSHKGNPAQDAPSDLWNDDERIDQPGYLTDLLGDQAVKAIKGYARAKQPFLISLHFNAPHWPWEGPDDEEVSGQLRSIYGFDNGSLKTYARMVERLDFQVGRVLEALKISGIAKNTIVILPVIMEASVFPIPGHIQEK